MFSSEFLPVAALTGLVVFFHEFFDVMGVGAIRRTYNVPSPGPSPQNLPPLLRRALRTQGNQAEQMLLFFPALWIHALFCSPKTAMIYGTLWFIIRIFYSFTYRTTAKDEPELTRFTYPCYFLLAFLALSPVARAILEASGHDFETISNTYFVGLQLGIHVVLLACAITYHRWLRSTIPEKERRMKE